MPRKGLDQPVGVASFAEPFVLERSLVTRESAWWRGRTAFGDRCETNHDAEYEPWRRRCRVGILRPDKPATADEPTIDADGFRPFDYDRLCGGAIAAIARASATIPA